MTQATLVKVERVYVTPRLAEQYLALNLKNRTISPNRVAELAGQMTAGLWKESGQTVSISSDNTLLDGQHRLAAIIASGTNQYLQIARNVDPSAFSVIDTGLSRSNNAVLNLTGVPYYGIITAGASQLYRVVTGSGRVVRVPPSYILEIMDRYPRLSYWAKRLGSSTVRRKVPSSSLLPALVYLDSIAKRPELAQELFDKLETGADMSVGDPILAFQNRLQSSRTANAKSDTSNVWPGMVRCVSALEAGRKVSKITMVPNSGFQEAPEAFEKHKAKLSDRELFVDLQPAVARANIRAVAKIIEDRKTSAATNSKAA